MDTSKSTVPQISGRIDTRQTPLDQLAATAEERPGQLSHVLPPDSSGRVPVARFGSSI